MKNVLVVEDDKDIQEALGQILRHEGFRVFSAYNGREALEHLRNGEEFCLILLDMIMPEMDGEEFLQAMQRDRRLAPIPVIAMTAGNRVPPNVVDSIPKPIELEPLLRRIEDHCSK
jgi:CheY-like chemotaxis protein